MSQGIASTPVHRITESFRLEQLWQGAFAMSSPSSLCPKPTQQGHGDSLVPHSKDFVQEGR